MKKYLASNFILNGVKYSLKNDVLQLRYQDYLKIAIISYSFLVPITMIVVGIVLLNLTLSENSFLQGPALFIALCLIFFAWALNKTRRFDFISICYPEFFGTDIPILRKDHLSFLDHLREQRKREEQVEKQKLAIYTQGVDSKQPKCDSFD